MLAAIAVVPGCSASRVAAECGYEGCPPDQKVTAAVRASLAQHTELRPPNLIYVQTLDGVVYLTGQVATDLQRETAVDVARQVPGVHKVVDNIALNYPGR